MAVGTAGRGKDSGWLCPLQAGSALRGYVVTTGVIDFTAQQER